jgi:hypothetical protein
MDQIIWKIKLLVLWIFQILNFVTVLIIPYSFSIISAEIGESTGALITFYIFLTCLMMWLTVVLKPSTNRWPAILVAAFYSLVKVQWIIRGFVGEYAIEFIFNEIWGLVSALALICYGWRIPRAQPNE